MVDVGIVGGTGYTGVELLRLLALHPQVRIAAVTSRADVGKPVAEAYPNLLGAVDARFVAAEAASLKDCDVVF
ncbi:MAG: N-acetyl-gamma-glutamyl-phosphate reductase, partial [Gammaproteobacteria bacterium]|nr:N-acetyl-gamma-glutamyl-phosphate reductase [Gammaproteobacteria bacterium]